MAGRKQKALLVCDDEPLHHLDSVYLYSAGISWNAYAAEDRVSHCWSLADGLLEVPPAKDA